MTDLPSRWRHLRAFDRLCLALSFGLRFMLVYLARFFGLLLLQVPQIIVTRFGLCADARIGTG